MQKHSTNRTSQNLARLSARLIAVAIASMTYGTLYAAPPLESAPAPDFALKSMNESNVRLSEYLGQVVLINFWATWCGPCRQQMPLLDQLHDKYERAGLVLLGINIDEDRDEAIEMAQTLQITYPILFDTRKDVSRAYEVGAMPLTVLIDREGLVRYVAEGYKPGYEKRYTEKLRELLGE